MLRSSIFAALIAAAALSLPAAARPLTVVELFTSQGCSSCPPADALLEELARRDDVLALSEHVEYWDYLGWKDALANAAVGRRQRDYARRFGLRYVYTPQMVIQGAIQLIGSDRTEVLRRLDEAEPARAVEVDVRRAGTDRVVVSVKPGGGAASAGRAAAKDADVWLALFDKRHTVRVQGGENNGRVLRYANAVRDLKRIGTWSGDPLTITVPMGEAGTRSDGCAVIVQSRAGPILGAARLDLTEN